MGRVEAALFGITEGFQARSQSDTEFLSCITEGKFATKHLKPACTGITDYNRFGHIFIKARLKLSQNFL